MKCYLNKNEVKIEKTLVMPPPYNQSQECPYVICTMDEVIQVEIAYEKEIASAVVRPLSAGISCRIFENRVFFTVDKPCNLSVEVNDDPAESLFLFVNEKKEEGFEGYHNIIRLDQPVYDLDELKITRDHTLVYIAEGTVVNGRIVASGVEHLKICGSGILTMKNYTRFLPEDMLRCLQLDHCRNVTLEDIGVFDSCNWSVRLNGCDEVTIRNLKIIGWRGNSDGIDVCGSRNVHVTDCFIRSYDDCFVVKGFDTGNVENVLFEKSVLWNDMARPIEVGVELRCEEVKHVVFRDIDVIHSLTCYPIFGIHHGDRAKISDIHFENIRIEHAPGAQLFDFRITDSVWNKDAQKGNIKDIYVKDIFLVGKEGKDYRTLQARIDGFSETSDIKNVQIENIVAFGKRVTNQKMLGLQVQGYVQNVVFVEEAESCSYLESSLEIVDAFVLKEDGKYHGRIKLTMKNLGKETVAGIGGIRIFPKNKARVNEEVFPYEIKAGALVEEIYDIVTIPGKLAIESFADRIDFKPQTVYIQLPYVLTEKIEDAPVAEFSSYYGDWDGEVRFSLKNGWLTICSEVLKQHDILLYAALPAKPCDNEVMFSIEESYFGEAPSLKLKNGDYVPAPEIGNHLEITYVFLNQPKVEKITKFHVTGNLDGMMKIPLRALGFADDTKEFWLEAELKKHTGYGKPYTLFRSTLPEDTAHMFCHFTYPE